VLELLDGHSSGCILHDYLFPIICILDHINGLPSTTEKNSSMSIQDRSPGTVIKKLSAVAQMASVLKTSKDEVAKLIEESGRMRMKLVELSDIKKNLLETKVVVLREKV
jgi:hypothetical protein